LVKENRESRLP